MFVTRAALVFAVALAATTSAGAKINLVKNGSFSSATYTSNSEFGGSVKGGGYTRSQGVTDWHGGRVGSKGADYSLQFYFIAGTQTTVTANDHYHDKKAYLYPGAPLSPDGGNFIALDGDSHVRGQISQTITGLHVGATYDLSFYWAATQLANRRGATTEQLETIFGTQKAFTPIVANPSKGFTGWMTANETFKPTAASQLLQFLSIGTPSGLPPLALLDGVSLTEAVPEPASWALLVAGFGCVGIAARRRRITVAA